MDGTKFNRVTDSTVIALGSAATNNSAGDPSFRYFTDPTGTLTVSAAMQATARTTPNWVRLESCIIAQHLRVC